jgi:3-hydroxyisobutyrate dehydrogenase-like beta-hydroxyacid dehydrogenase
MSPAVGFIGAGNLGEPMVNRLLDAGHDVHVFARHPEVRARLSNRGARLTDSLGELASRGDVLIGCLFSDAQLREVAVGAKGLLAQARPGCIFVSHTTGNASTIRELAASARPGVEVLDAPVSGTAADIAVGALTVLVSGDAAAIERAAPFLRSYADPIVPVGDLGAALTIKVVNNLVFAANAQILAGAVEFVRSCGLDEGAFLAAVRECSGGSRAADYALDSGSVAQFAARVTPYLRKDVAVAETTASEAGLDIGWLLSTIASGQLDLVRSERLSPRG